MAIALAMRGLADAGHVLDEQVALGEQADEGEQDDVVLALDDLTDVLGDGADDGRGAVAGCDRLLPRHGRAIVGVMRVLLAVDVGWDEARRRPGRPMTGEVLARAEVPTPTADDGDAEVWFAALAARRRRRCRRATRSRAASAAADRWRPAARTCRR